MKDSLFERVITNNFIWNHIQREYIVPFWSKSLVLPKGFLALELGCRSGVCTTILYDYFKPDKLNAFEPNEQYAQRACELVSIEYAGKIMVSPGKFSSILAPDEQYDVVFDFFNINRSQDWHKSIKEVSRVLKPGGYFAFGEIYDLSIGKYLSHSLFKKPVGDVFNRKAFVKQLANNKLRLLEENKNLWGHGIIGVAKKS